MDVEIAIFPETKVAAIEHFGSPSLEYDSACKLIAWKLGLCLLYNIGSTVRGAT
jgi:DNA gyrase inhibitor GyrI